MDLSCRAGRRLNRVKKLGSFPKRRAFGNDLNQYQTIAVMIDI